MDRRGFLQLASAWAAALPALSCTGTGSEQDLTVLRLSDRLRVVRGPANAGLLADGSRVLALPGDPRPSGETAEMKLFSSARRDAEWAGLRANHREAGDDRTETRRSRRSGPGSSRTEPDGDESARPRVRVPSDAERLFRRPDSFWSAFRTERFHDYSQQSTRLLTRPISVSETVSGGRVIEWGEATVEVLDTPGYSPRAVSYLVDDAEIRAAFTGDLCYGDGQILDLFSLQDAIPEADLRGYHGYLSRAAELIESLEAVLDRNPDVMVPARGPLIRDPEASAQRLIRRLRLIYESYLSTTALRWYFGEEHIRTCAGRILASGAGGPAGGRSDADTVSSSSGGEDEDGGMGPLPEAVVEAETRKPPSWIVPIRNSRLLLSESGAGFLVDCGYDAIIEEVDRRIERGRLDRVDGIYVTHYHDDHTDRVQKAAEHFDCPVHCCSELEEILRHPERYRMPALTDRPIRSLEVMSEGERVRWHEFTLTYSYFPGQTRYHGGLRVVRGTGAASGAARAESGDELDRPVFFAGDAFTPSGMDDYCMQNRNLMHPGSGYLHCLDRLAEMNPLPWLVNQHVEPLFRFTRGEIRDLADAFRARRQLIAAAVPWEDPNFGTDAGWARCHPYQVSAEEGTPISVAVRIFNHAPGPRVFSIRPHPPTGWRVTSVQERVELEARSEGKLRIELEPREDPPPELGVMTVDVDTPDRLLPEWTEALLTRS